MKVFLWFLFVFILPASVKGQVLAPGDGEPTTSTYAKIEAILVQLDIKSSVVTDDLVKEAITKAIRESKRYNYNDLKIYFTNEKLSTKNQHAMYINANTPFGPEQVVKYKITGRNFELNKDTAYFFLDVMVFVYNYHTSVYDDDDYFDGYPFGYISIKNRNTKEIVNDLLCKISVQRGREIVVHFQDFNCASWED